MHRGQAFGLAVCPRILIGAPDPAQHVSSSGRRDAAKCGHSAGIWTNVGAPTRFRDVYVRSKLVFGRSTLQRQDSTQLKQTQTFTMAASEKNNELIEAARRLQHTPSCDDYERMISGML